MSKGLLDEARVEAEEQEAPSQLPKALPKCHLEVASNPSKEVPSKRQLSLEVSMCKYQKRHHFQDKWWYLVIAGSAYVGYKLGKLRSRFMVTRPIYLPGAGHGIEFDTWNEWRSSDGFLCRNDSDCNWIDSNLNCQNYTLDFTPRVRATLFCVRSRLKKWAMSYIPIQGQWFGGNVSQTTGVCLCDSDNLFWDDDYLACKAASSGLGETALIAIAVVLAILFVLIIFAVFFVKKRFCWLSFVFLPHSRIIYLFYTFTCTLDFGLKPIRTSGSCSPQKVIEITNFDLKLVFHQLSWLGIIFFETNGVKDVLSLWHVCIELVRFTSYSIYVNDMWPYPISLRANVIRIKAACRPLILILMPYFVLYICLLLLFFLTWQLLLLVQGYHQWHL